MKRRIVLCRLVADEKRDTADVWLVNSCTVKNPSQAAMGSLLARGRALGKVCLTRFAHPAIIASVAREACHLTRHLYPLLWEPPNLVHVWLARRWS